MAIKCNFVHFLVKWFLWFFVQFWHFQARFLQVSKIKNKHLYPLRPSKNRKYPEFQQNIGYEVLKYLQSTLDNGGDYTCLINGCFSLEGTTSSCGTKSKSLGQVIQDAKKYGAAFWQAGLRKGDVVHFAIPNNTEYHSLAIGVWLCEGVTSLGDPGLPPTVLNSQLLDTKAKFVVCYESSRKNVHQALKQSSLLGAVQVIILEKSCPASDEDLDILDEPGFTFFNDFLNNVQDAHETPPRLQDGILDENDTLVIFWSSGTTGQPKGIQHSVKLMKYLIYAMAKFRRPGHPVLTTTCFFHAGGFCSILDLMMYRITWIFNHGEDLERSSSQLLYGQIDKFRPWNIIGGSHHLVCLSQESPCNTSLDLSSVLLVFPVGSTLPLTIYKDLGRFLPNLVAVGNGFAMSEFYTVCAVTFDVRYLGAVGPDVELKVMDAETGQLCGPDQVGELMAKGYGVMKGYLNRPEENAEFFADDGFIHTGDFVSYNSSGMLKYEGRKKELIKYKNYHLYPLELENIICKHPKVLEAGVFGRPDPTVQELVTAAVVLAADSNDVSEQEIIDMVNKNVADSKKLRGGVIFVDKLPKNPVGKTQRRKLLEMYNLSKFRRDRQINEMKHLML